MRRSSRDIAEAKSSLVSDETCSGEMQIRIKSSLEPIGPGEYVDCACFSSSKRLKTVNCLRFHLNLALAGN